jgi:dihydrofolate reductase
MRHVKLSVACSLDGHIAAPDGGIDWIRMDVDYGMQAFLDSVDATLTLIGRGTYDFARNTGNRFFRNMKNYVFSRSLPPGPSDEVVVISENAVSFVQQLKQQPGRDIWLFGGHALTASLLQAGLLDEITLAIHPILLGGGTPLFSRLANRQPLELVRSKNYKNGVLVATYRAKP